LNKPNIILVIASSIDGRISFPLNEPTHIGSLEDKKILNNIISKVDATIFGSGTLKVHQSTFLVKNFIDKTKFIIKEAQPISIIVGNPNNFNKEWLYFNQPIKRWLINSNPQKIRKNMNFEKEFVYTNSWLQTLSNLKKEGIQTIALLGGAKLIYSFMMEDLIDEINITIVPKIIGGDYIWLPYKNNEEILNFKKEWIIKTFEQLKTNEIFIHYIKNK
tara:strand:+ start:105 stop:758 length:654 start_codon:yes stop_codon:yes gene_type:complete